MFVHIQYIIYIMCMYMHMDKCMQSMYIHGIETKDSFISELYCSIERPAKLVNKSGLTPTPP